MKISLCLYWILPIVLTFQLCHRSFRPSFRPSFSSLQQSRLQQASERSFHVTTIEGFEKQLADEIRSKVEDAVYIKLQKRGVSFTGTARSGFQAILWLRTALKCMEKIENPIAQKDESMSISTKDDLYDYIKQFNWLSMIHFKQTLKCDTIFGSSNSETLTHSHFTSLTVKNAIIDQFRDYYHVDNKRPSIDLVDPDLPLLLYLHKNQPFLYRVWSGESSMHKRGYRSDATIHKASLRETTAAGM
jgi:23S rRNA G2445 N2-methylase RlmL